jgi:hypothetical protein
VYDVAEELTRSLIGNVVARQPRRLVSQDEVGLARTWHHGGVAHGCMDDSVLAKWLSLDSKPISLAIVGDAVDQN